MALGEIKINLFSQQDVPLSPFVPVNLSPRIVLIESAILEIFITISGCFEAKSFRSLGSFSKSNRAGYLIVFISYGIGKPSLVPTLPLSER